MLSPSLVISKISSVQGEMRMLGWCFLRFGHVLLVPVDNATIQYASKAVIISNVTKITTHLCLKNVNFWSSDGCFIQEYVFFHQFFKISTTNVKLKESTACTRLMFLPIIEKYLVIKMENEATCIKGKIFLFYKVIFFLFQGTGDMARLRMEILTGFLLILVKTVKDREIPYDVLIFQQRGLDVYLFLLILLLIIFSLYQWLEKSKNFVCLLLVLRCLI